MVMPPVWSILPDGVLKPLTDVHGRLGFSRRDYLLLTVLALAAALCEGVGLALFVPTLRDMIAMDHARAGRGSFIMILGLIFLMLLLKSVFSYAVAVGCARLGSRFAHELRMLLFNRCLGYGKLYFDQSNLGQLQGTQTSSIDAVAGQVVAFQEALTAFWLVLVYFALMCRISWKLTLLVAVLLPVLQHVLRQLVETVRKASRAHAQSRRALTGHLSNILSSVLLVQFYSQEDAERRRFEGVSGSVQQHDLKMDSQIALVRPIQEITVVGVLFTILIAMTGLLGPQNSGIAPQILVYCLILRRTATVLGVLGNSRSNLARLQGPLEEIMRLLDPGDKHQVRGGDREFRGLENSLEVRNLSFAFPNGVKVLDNLSFTMKRGKITAIVGPSGTGKTTLINLILRFYEPASGAILADGADIKDFTLKSLRDRMALVSQDTLLFNDTLEANIRYGLNGRVSDNRLMEAVSQARLTDFISALPDKLATRIGDRGLRLSGGERQRLSIARAILREADILFLDEATSSLDSRTENLIQASLADLLKDKTAVVIAHRLSTIRGSDKIVVIEGGKMVEQGLPHELLAGRGAFYRYWQRQGIIPSVQDPPLEAPTQR